MVVFQNPKDPNQVRYFIFINMYNFDSTTQKWCSTFYAPATLASGIDIGQGINVGPEKFGKKNKRRALNTHVLCSK